MPSTISEASVSSTGRTAASTMGWADATPGTARTTSSRSSGTPASPAVTSSWVRPAMRSTVWRMETRSDIEDSSMAMKTPTPRATPAAVSRLISQWRRK